MAADQTPSPDPRQGQDEWGELQDRVVEMEDRLRRYAADLDNTRKRQQREALRQQEVEQVRIAAQFLPVIDNLDRALEHSAGDPEALVAGVRAVRDQAVELLAALGFPRRDEVGVPFDPNRHEAVSTVADPAAPPNTVVRVLLPGYGDEDRQLRPAAVVVSTGAG